MIAVDTNILIYAHRRDSPFHMEAKRVLKELAESGEPWAIPWPCVHEFLAVVTHPKALRPPSTVAEAIDQVDAWLTGPYVVPLGESASHRETLMRLLRQGHVHSGAVHDARIAAICIDHGATLWSADRDFNRFPALKVVNPLVGRG